MARLTAKQKAGIGVDEGGEFDLRGIFPDAPGLKRGPFPKQQRVYDAIVSGQVAGGGFVYQGGKGCAKTICGVAGTVMVHHVEDWRGLTSAVCRESYPALMTSTWPEFEAVLNRLPGRAIRAINKPSINSMGSIEWAAGGKTLFLSLSDSRTWASVNLGFAWVDEGHLQQEKVVDALCDRLRQERSPRTMLLTTNPMGHSWFWRWANEKSKETRPAWEMVESSMFENPALPQDYVARMEAKYPRGTAAHKRWVLGQSAALEGSAFEGFYPDPSDKIHVVPMMDLDPQWPRGRGLDWGIDNPCVVVWGARDPDTGDWWIYRTHTQAGRSAGWHANRILELEYGEDIRWTPSDPEIFRKNHFPDGSSAPSSTADQFRANGCRVSSANNNRVTGLERVLDLIAVDEDKLHPVTLKPGRPKLFFLDTPDNEATIACLANIKWRPAPQTGSTDSPDDVEKKDDHWYDALRYLVVEVQDGYDRAPFAGRMAGKRGDGSYRGY